jgi:hypothetical protein
MKKREPKVKEPETYEEFLAQAWESFQTHYADYDANVPPCNYPFKVGESVRYGNRPEPRVEEILKEGRLLHLSVHDRGETYGKPWDNHRRIPVLTWWVQVDPIALEEDTAFGRPRINAQYLQTSMFME